MACILFGQRCSWGLSQLHGLAWSYCSSFSWVIYHDIYIYIYRDISDRVPLTSVGEILILIRKAIPNMLVAAHSGPLDSSTSFKQNVSPRVLRTDKWITNGKEKILLTSWRSKHPDIPWRCDTFCTCQYCRFAQRLFFTGAGRFVNVEWPAGKKNVLFCSVRFGSCALCTCPRKCGGAFTQHSVLKRKLKVRRQQDWLWMLDIEISRPLKSDARLQPKWRSDGIIGSLSSFVSIRKALCCWSRMIGRFWMNCTVPKSSRFLRPGFILQKGGVGLSTCQWSHCDRLLSLCVAVGTRRGESCATMFQGLLCLALQLSSHVDHAISIY